MDKIKNALCIEFEDNVDVLMAISELMRDTNSCFSVDYSNVNSPVLTIGDVEFEQGDIIVMISGEDKIYRIGR